MCEFLVQFILLSCFHASSVLIGVGVLGFWGAVRALFLAASCSVG